MELDLGPEIAQFRGEVRHWLAGDGSYHREHLALRIGL